MRPSVLTIAGSDPCGGAGIQADLRVFNAMNAVGLSAITALTVQNSQGVQSVHPVPGEILGNQIESILSDVQVGAVKIGMLGGAAQVRVVAELLRRFRPPNIVLDPVLSSTAGISLLDEDGRQAMRKELLPLCRVITPNLPEARILAGFLESREGNDSVAAQRLLSLGAQAVLLTGGHAPSAVSDGQCTDWLLIEGEPEVSFTLPWIATPHTHGTGCMHSSALATGLALGMSLATACEQAKKLVAFALRSPVIAGKGRGYPDAGSLIQPVHSEDTRTHAERLRLMQGLYVLTDSDLRPERNPASIVQSALRGGATIVQLREKRLATSEMIILARHINSLARAANALFIVNDRVDVALASDADGVHLGPEDMSPADARRLLGPDKLVGISVSNATEAIKLAPFASYLGVGAIYGSKTKKDAGAAVGVDPIRAIKREFPNHPLVAIGGINIGNIQEIFHAGADAAAVISAVVCAQDMQAATEVLISVVQNALVEK